MFVINGSDYTIIVLALAVALALFGLQYLLCRKAKSMFPKLIPAFIVALTFAASLLCLTGDSGGGFIDLSGFFAAVIAVIGLVWGLFIGAAWLLSRRK